jgi:FixJ family two-component response regulator
MNLTQKEQEIISYLIQGYNAKQMASEIGLSRSRIHCMLADMKRRFDCGNSEMLCVLATLNYLKTN